VCQQANRRISQNLHNYCIYLFIFIFIINIYLVRRYLTVIFDHFTANNADMPAPLLAGQTALITGASKGIGGAITRTLANKGASCILMGRDAIALNAQVAQLPGQNHIVFRGDVSYLDTWTKFEEENAGSYQPSPPNIRLEEKSISLSMLRVLYLHGKSAD
jgi:short chain dehydrogenase